MFVFTLRAVFVRERDTEQSKERMHNHTLMQGFLDYTGNFITCLPGVPVPAIFVIYSIFGGYYFPSWFSVN